VCEIQVVQHGRVRVVVELVAVDHQRRLLLLRVHHRRVHVRLRLRLRLRLLREQRVAM
jgi:hypothetical protein